MGFKKINVGGGGLRLSVVRVSWTRGIGQAICYGGITVQEVYTCVTWFPRKKINHEMAAREVSAWSRKGEC